MTIFSEVLIFAAFWLFAVLSTLFYMHMFQLNSYRADDQWHWMLKNRGKVVPLALPLIGAIIGVICGKNAGMIVCAVFILLACLFYKPKKAKKPLNYTPSVKRMLVTVAVLYVAMTVLLAVFASGRITALVVGLVAAAFISMKRGLLTENEYQQIRTGCELYRLPAHVNGLDPQKVLAATKKDKKMEQGTIKFILMNGIGKSFIDRTVTDEELLSGIQEILQ